MEKYFSVNEQGNSIKCKIYCDSPKAVKKAVIYGHGFSGHKDNKAAERFAEYVLKKHRDTAVVTYDAPCHGDDVKKKLSLSDCGAYLGLVTRYVEKQYHTDALYAYATSFGGYQFLKYISENGNLDALKEWLDTDMSENIRDQKKVMFKIVRALDKASNYPSRGELLERVLDLIKTKWIARLFAGADQANQNELLINTSDNGHAGDGPDRLLRDAYDGIAEGGRMYRQLDAVIIRVISQRPLDIRQNFQLNIHH